MNRREAYEYGIQTLTEAGFEEAKTDLFLLLDGLFHISMTDLFTHGDVILEQEEEQLFKEALKKRLEHIPVQHITAVQNFMGLSFYVNEHVLIPRQDTEILVEEVLKQLHDGFSILDMCTGSGCIAISLAKYSNDCCITAVDLSEEALAVAKKNSEDLELNIEFVHSNLFEKISGKYDFIVSNPPYIPTDVIEGLMDEVKLHDPRMALDGKEDGLYFYREIIRESVNYLNRGGMLFFEIGYDQGEAVSKLMKEAGFQFVEVIQDYAGLDRVVYGSH